ncbi:hypothetical protein APR11_000015 [Nocardia amikacinitolerans]|uniref:hypothetical protein n=1 Tax=Nocardia amikacinitolerans TaxID=756689 RepID=UPI0020A5DDCC|nr:hypothetical protein [Nocardia amikacinitolerans]MCP2293611.1 hypothetical protein [Nocardia amikacinitolerans]
MDTWSSTVHHTRTRTAEHPITVNLREDHLAAPIDRWLATLFNRANRDRTIASLFAAQNGNDHDTHRALLRRRIADADAKLERHLAAIEAGVDPQALVAAMNTAQADKAAAQSPEPAEHPTVD